MVHLRNMAELMHNDEIRERGVDHHKSYIETQCPRTRTAAPTCTLIANTDTLVNEAIKLIEKLKSTNNERPSGGTIG